MKLLPGTENSPKSMCFQFLNKFLQRTMAALSHKCPFCGASKAWSKALENHLRIHTKEKPYSYDICGKSRSRIKSLRDHINTHSIENLFQCNICKNRYSSKRSQRQHMRIHRRNKPYWYYICI